MLCFCRWPKKHPATVALLRTVLTFLDSFGATSLTPVLARGLESTQATGSFRQAMGLRMDLQVLLLPAASKAPTLFLQADVAIGASILTCHRSQHTHLPIQMS